MKQIIILSVLLNFSFVIKGQTVDEYLDSTFLKYDENDFEGALKYINKALKLNFENDNLHYNRALCLYNLANYKEAIKGYSKAIQINSKVADYYSQRGGG